MSAGTGLLVAILGLVGDPLVPGDHARTVVVGGISRVYLVHVPPSYDRRKPTPVVLALHPFATNALAMVRFTGLNETADRAGFLAVYPNGTGKTRVMLAWNVGGLGPKESDDVGYVAKLLDDLGAVATVDSKRVYATGMSNGAMMCYRLADELSDRIAAIAPVAGTMGPALPHPKRPLSVLHFHGTEDTFIPYHGPNARTPRSIQFRPVDVTIKLWAEADGCPAAPRTAEVQRTADDGLRIQRTTYGPGREGSEVILYTIEGGGHVWPGRDLRAKFLGKTPLDLSANDLMWDFFQKHPIK